MEISQLQLSALETGNIFTVELKDGPLMWWKLEIVNSSIKIREAVANVFSLIKAKHRSILKGL